MGWFSLIPLAVAVWLAGVAKLGAEHLFALVRLELMRRKATSWPEPTPVPVRGCALLMSEDCPGPMTWGVLRPVIMLPDEALDWPADRLATVLRHELAHVRRRDGLAQALAVTACALYWPNPLVWGAARALRREAELAADDAVIAAGVRPSDYAGQLLELAAEWRERRLTPTGLAMAAPPALSQRVQSILSTDAIRTGATAMDTCKLILLGGAATAALTLARPSVAEVPAPSAPAAQQVELSGAVPFDSETAKSAQHLELGGVGPLPSGAKAAAPAQSGDPKSMQPHGQVYQFTLRHGADQASADRGGVTEFRLARQDGAAPAAAASAPAIASTPLPPLPPGPAGATTVFGVVAPGQVPYNPVTDDPASPGYIAPGQPGAGHPVPPGLAKQLNGRQTPGAPWTLSWLPNPNGQSATFIGGRMTPEQRAELDRQTAAIGPAIDKAIKDAHIDETVQKALSAQDAKTREEVAKQLQQIGPLVQQAIAMAQIQEMVGQRMAQLGPQMEAARKQAQERAAQAEDRVAAQLEEQAKRARERAQRAREQLNTAPQPAQPPKN